MTKGDGFRPRLGKHGSFRWIVAKQHLRDLLALCPDVVIGKYVAITSLDSVPVRLLEEESLAGWTSIHDIAYSPQIARTAILPYEGYDEWYIFESPKRLGRLADPREIPSDASPDLVHCFVNYGGFGPHQLDLDGNCLLDHFWWQLEKIEPQTFIADGDCLSIVTSDEVTYEAVILTLGIEKSE
jgi:hypothetical protein